MSELSTPKRFRGKIAPWWYAIAGIMLLGTVIFLVQTIGAFLGGNSELGILMLVLTVVFVLFDLLLVDSCFRNYVDFYDDHMRVVFRFLKRT